MSSYAQGLSTLVAAEEQLGHVIATEIPDLALLQKSKPEAAAHVAYHIWRMQFLERGSKLPHTPVVGGPVMVEGGHLYFPDRIDSDSSAQIGLRLTEKIVLALREGGEPGKAFFFVDDRNDWGDRWRSQAFAFASLVSLTSSYALQSGEKLSPEQWLLESELSPPACRLLPQIRDAIRQGDNAMNARLIANENKIQIGSRRNGITINLIDAEHGGPSCEILDLACYNLKLASASAAVTILPATFKEQQNRVQMLYKLLGIEPAVINIFFTPEQGTLEISPWNGACSGIAAALAEVGFKL